MANMLGDTKDRDALYYPYIHFRDDEWVKRTLLVFPALLRMVPREELPNDSDFVRQLLRTQGLRGPLIQSANLWTKSVMDAQAKLIEKLRADIKEEGQLFLNRFSRSVVESTTTAEFGFQIHPEKASYELIEFLQQNGLAWIPDLPDRNGSLQMHPTIGQAIMSTIAIACAEADGLDIVTNPKDEDRGELNLCVATHSRDDIYDVLVRGKEPVSAPASGMEGAILELLVYQHCNPERVTPAGLAAISHDWTALQDLKRNLKELVNSIPEMKNQTKLHSLLEERVREVLKRWEEDRINMSNVSKEIFGIEGFKPSNEIFKTIAQNFAVPVVLGGDVLGKLISQPLLGAAAGVAVGVVVHVGTSIAKVRARAKESPYRYLAKMHKLGVVYTLGS